MDLKQVEHDYAVAGQIAESDLAALKAAGYQTVICNRPDAEVEPGLHAQFMAAEAARLGLVFVYNPISNQGMTMDNLTAQAEALAAATGPVLAYCRSGMRSTTAWALIRAKDLPLDEIIASAAGAGYDLSRMAPAIEAMAAA
jgi:uncharacterized protein (TIGR01244 family)